MLGIVLGMLWEEITTVGVTFVILNYCGWGLIAVYCSGWSSKLWVGLNVVMGGTLYYCGCVLVLWVELFVVVLVFGRSCRWSLIILWEGFDIAVGGAQYYKVFGFKQRRPIDV